MVNVNVIGVSDTVSSSNGLGNKRQKIGLHLYVIRSDAGTVKIGRSNSPRKRLATLKTANGNKLELVKVFRNRGGEEATIHAALAKHRVRGEWFGNTYEFREAFKALIGVDFKFSAPDLEYEDMDAKARRYSDDFDAMMQDIHDGYPNRDCFRHGKRIHERLYCWPKPMGVAARRAHINRMLERPVE